MHTFSVFHHEEGYAQKGTDNKDLMEFIVVRPFVCVKSLMVNFVTNTLVLHLILGFVLKFRTCKRTKLEEEKNSAVLCSSTVHLQRSSLASASRSLTMGCVNKSVRNTSSHFVPNDFVSFLFQSAWKRVLSSWHWLFYYGILLSSTCLYFSRECVQWASGITKTPSVGRVVKAVA